MSYTNSDLVRAGKWFDRELSSVLTIGEHKRRLAEFVADVRREALEAAASHVENGVLIRGSSKDFARRIRALKDGAP